MVFITKSNKIDEQEITSFTAEGPGSAKRVIESRSGYYQRRRPTDPSCDRALLF